MQQLEPQLLLEKAGESGALLYDLEIHDYCWIIWEIQAAVNL